MNDPKPIASEEGRKLARRHPDIFTPGEAAEYLRMESERSLETAADKFGLVGFRVGKGLMYWREDLDQCAKRMFGRDGEWARVGNQPLKLYAGRR